MLVDTERVVSPDEVEAITGDKTIGRIQTSADDQLDGGTLFSVRRLRRLLLAYEDEFDTDDVYLSFEETETASGPVLVLKEHETDTRAVALAGKRDPDKDGDPA